MKRPNVPPLALALAAGAVGAACASAPPRSATSVAVGSAATPLRAPDDPTVRGARLIPESVDDSRAYGFEPGGGVRGIVAGVRVVSFGDGSIVAAEDRLPGAPSAVAGLPDRLGGGFLFAVGDRVWRSSGWLAPVSKLLRAAGGPVAQLFAGLDRAYLRTRSPSAPIAFDPTTGDRLDLGPLPASPYVGRVVAVDAWRAAAIADVRGVLTTMDAGTTWQKLTLPIEPNDLFAAGDVIAVGGLDASRSAQWWEVRGDGQASRVAPSAPNEGSDRTTIAPPSDPVARSLAPRPLAAALEDGWPLSDGTALVARDGALVRVRLSDGGIASATPHAFSLEPARCHPLALAHARDPDAFGFVCGEPRGRTIVYLWDTPARRLSEIARFDSPREVVGSGNGALAVRGSCAAASPSEGARGDEQAWCVRPPGENGSREWREVRFSGEDIARARVVVLRDGRIALVRPPHEDLSTARLTISDGVRVLSDVALRMPPLRADVARALRSGLWMDGFEERNAGRLGGWVDAAGSVIGIEIALDGATRVGEYIQDAGAPVVSGRYGFGWTASRRGYETTDGGMTWRKDIDLPEPIASPRAVRVRACGPVGCIAAGWLRVGWGESAAAQSGRSERDGDDRDKVVGPRSGQRASPSLDLQCEPLSGAQPEAKLSLARAAAAAPTGRSGPAPLLAPRPWASAFTMSNYGTVSEFPAFYGHEAPAIPADDRGLLADVASGVDRWIRVAPLARVTAWGPSAGEWDQLGRVKVSWLWPWGSHGDVRASAVSPSPWATLEVARRSLGGQPGMPVAWALAPGDDPDHALLVSRHVVGGPSGSDITVLETDRAPVEVRRAGGEPFAEVESAVRVADRWYVATTQSPGEIAGTIVWRIDDSTAREIARLPRAAFETRPALRLARRSDARALGIVIDGQADLDHPSGMRWLVAVDLETGAAADPEPLAPFDLSDRTVGVCSADDGGWQLDLPWPGPARVHIAATGASAAYDAVLQSSSARLRVSRDRACVERLVGSIDPAAAAVAPALVRATAPRARSSLQRTIDVAIVHARTRISLRCSHR